MDQLPSVGPGQVLADNHCFWRAPPPLRCDDAALGLRSVPGTLAVGSYVERPPRQELFQTFPRGSGAVICPAFLRGHRPLASMKSAMQVADQNIAL